MNITTTLGELVNAEPALARVLAVKFDKDGGAKVRYHAVKLARLVAAETKHFTEERDALVEAHGKGEPKSIAINTPAMGNFLAALKPLGAVPVVLPWGPLTDAMLAPYPDITGLDQFSLGPLFVFEDEVKE